MWQHLGYVAALFGGYAIGRLGHIVGGHWRHGPDHWIYGAALFFVGFHYQPNFTGYVIILGGLGLFISDLNDFLNLKWYGPDKVEIKRFWGFD